MKRPRAEGGPGFGMHGGMGFGGMGGMMEGGPGGYMGGPDQFMGAGMGAGMGGSFPCVKLRGLPFDVTEEDIRMFLGLEAIDTILLKRDGRLTGEAFVVLPGNMQVELALQKNRSYMGRRYIEIYRAKKTDYYRAVVSEMESGGGFGYGGRDAPPPRAFHRDEPSRYPGGGDGGYGGGGDGYARGGAGGARGTGGDAGSAGTTIIKLRGLPFSVSDEDICQWFNEDTSLGLSPVVKDNVLVVSENGRPNGIAFVEFPTPAEATQAMAKNKQMMGTRYIEIFPASRADLERHT